MYNLLTSLANKVLNISTKIYPVGSIYMSVNDTSPALLFGGTWERIQDRFLLAAGSSYSAGSTGGETSHKLTIDEMPNHGHGAYYTNNGVDEKVYSWFTASGNDLVFKQVNTGGSQPHNNMPPYLTVYIGKRTA